MAFPVIGGSQSGGYLIDNSLRFNDNDSPYLSKSFSTVTNTKKFTVSFWFKPSAIPQSNYSGFLDVGGDNAFALFSDSTIYFFEQGGAQFYWRPQRLFRDCSAWYHIVLACDSTLATQTDRVKIYVNGVRETSFHNNSGPSQNYDFGLNTTSNTRYIGTKVSTSAYYDGYLAEYYQIDGQQLQASDFGDFDEDSGIWKPKIYEGNRFSKKLPKGTFSMRLYMGLDENGKKIFQTFVGTKKQLKKIFAKYEISIKNISYYNYVKDFKINYSDNLFGLTNKLLNGLNPKEISFKKRSYQKQSFFEKFFNFFN